MVIASSSGPIAKLDRNPSRGADYRSAGRRTITTIAAAIRIPAAAIAAQTHPDSPDDDATGATAAADVLIAVVAEPADEAIAAWPADESAETDAVADASAPLTAPSAS